MEKSIVRQTSFDTKNIECSVCQGTLLDPRALPCGHSYCGPERDCLEAVRLKKGGLKCVVCREKYTLDISQLKPLYGIRDYLKQIQSTSSSHTEDGDKQLIMDCGSHPGTKAELWCIKCQVNVCSQCVESNHDEHPMRTLRKHFHREVSSRLHESFKTFLNYMNKLKKAENTAVQMLETRRIEIKEIEEYGEKLASEDLRLGSLRSVYEELEKFVDDIKYDIDFDIVELFITSKLFDFQTTKSLLAERYLATQFTDLSLSFETKIFICEGEKSLNYFNFKAREINFSVGSNLFQNEQFGIPDCLSIEINWVPDDSVTPEMDFYGEVSVFQTWNRKNRYSSKYRTTSEDGAIDKVVVNLEIGNWQDLFGAKVVNHVWSCILSFTINFPEQKVESMDMLSL